MALKDLVIRPDDGALDALDRAFDAVAECDEYGNTVFDTRKLWQHMVCEGWDILPILPSNVVRFQKSPFVESFDDRLLRSFGDRLSKFIDEGIVQGASESEIMSAMRLRLMAMVEEDES